jgi:hypothetical protein
LIFRNLLILPWIKRFWQFLELGHAELLQTEEGLKDPLVEHRRLKKLG